MLTAVSPASANEWVKDVEVQKIGTYHSATDHFVWFTTTPMECQALTGVMHFDEAQPGGKALLATFMTALVNKRKLDVQADGCKIFEVYLR